MIWNFKKHNNKTALISSKGKHISYNKLSEITNTIATKLHKRSLILCLSENDIPSIIGYLSFLNNNHIVILLDSNINHVNLFIEKWNPDYIWSSKQIDKTNTVYQYETYKLQQPRSKNSTIPYNKDLSLLLSTSGSTGNSKLVRISKENIVVNTKQIITDLHLTDKEVAITSLPMNYSYGLSIIHTHLYIGATIQVTNTPIISKDFWKLVKTSNTTSISAVPISYQFLNRLNLDTLDTIKKFTQAGGKLPKKIQEQFSEKCKKSKKEFYIMYGQTEATARISILQPNYSSSKLESVGKAISGGKLTLINDQNKIINKPHTTGEVIYKGDNVSMGNANTPEELSMPNTNKGILRTNDLGYFDNDGFYYITGRKDRTIKISGIRICIDELENYLKNKYVTLDIACVGNEKNICIYTTDIKSIDTLRKSAKSLTSINALFIKVKTIDVIPLTKNNKIDYKQLAL